MQDDAVERPPGKSERLWREGRDDERDRFVERRVEVQHLELPRRAVVSEDHLAAPQPPHQAGEVLQLGGGDARDAEHVEDHIDAAAEPERETPAGEPMHGGGEARGHDRVTGVVVGHAGGNAERLRYRADGSGECRRFLDVEALGDEDRAEPQPLGLLHLVDQRARRGWRAGQSVERELVEWPHDPRR